MTHNLLRAKQLAVALAVSLSASAQVGYQAISNDGEPFVSRMLNELNTFTGSAPSETRTAGLFGQHSEEWGQTIPAVLVPFGMNFWTPQTRATEQKCVAPFYYNDTLFQGFRNSHWIVGGCTQDYGSFTLMVKTSPYPSQGGGFYSPGTQALSPEQWATRFSHDKETSHPYYYAVALPDEQVYAEMTATSRAAIFRYSLTSGSEERGAGSENSLDKSGNVPSRSQFDRICNSVAANESICNAEKNIYLILYPNSDEGQGSVTIDVRNHLITATNPVHRIYQGWGESAGFAGHYALKYLKVPVEYGVFDGENVYPGQTTIANKENIGAYLCFEVTGDEPLLVKAGSSFTDVRGAVCNLEAEIPHWDFDRTCRELKAIWERRLSLMEAESLDSTLLRKFYGALYRASFLPHTISDADGRYPAFAQSLSQSSASGSVGATKILPLAPGETQYGDYSLWDTYRAQHPLINILTPSLANQMMQSLVRMYRQGGWLPIFPCWNSYTAAMIGDHASSVLADAWVKGIRSFDIHTAYEAMRKNAFESPKTYEEYKNGMGRRALKSYLKYGYIPLEDSVPEAFHQREQVSRTLEYAYDDFCVAQVAKALNKQDDYTELMRRSENWRHVIDKETGYAHPLPLPKGGDSEMYQRKNTADKHTKLPSLGEGKGVGVWVGVDPFIKQPYITEGAPCHYTWYVPQNPEGLMQVLGGKERFVAKLDSMFTCGRYWHGNEPCHQVAWMFNVAGETWRTQKYVRRIIDTEYLDAPGGLSGNDDAGQMSSWLLFACMGFYPVCPATPYYYIGAPVFPRLTLHLENGRTFTILADDVSAENIYVQHVTLNGCPLPQPYLSHDDILRGGTLHFKMGACPPVSAGR